MAEPDSMTRDDPAAPSDGRSLVPVPGRYALVRIEPPTEPPREGAKPYLLFVIGIVLGSLLAATMGWNLFPRQESAPLERGRRNAGNFRALRRERDQLRREVRELRASAGGSAEAVPLAPPPDGKTLADHLDARRWRELGEGIRSLLVAGEDGFEVLLDWIRAGIRGPFGGVEEEGALFPILRVVESHEEEVAAFLWFALYSEDFRNDRELKEWVLYRGAWFLASSRQKHEAARQALVQRLMHHLSEGGAGIWVILNGLELLGEVPIDSLSRVLSRADRDEVHGYVLKYLGRRGGGESVRVLEEFLGRAASGVDWKVTLALEALGKIDGKEAREVLAGYMDSTDPGIREMAHLAFVSGKRSVETDLPVLTRFLNSGSSVHTKRRVLRRLHLKNRALFEAVCANAASVTDALLREDLESAGAAPAAFSER